MFGHYSSGCFSINSSQTFKITLNKCWETTEIKIDIIVHLLYEFGHVSFVSKVFGAKKGRNSGKETHKTLGSKPKTYIKVIPSQMFYNYRIIKKKKRKKNKTNFQKCSNNRKTSASYPATDEQSCSHPGTLVWFQWEKPPCFIVIVDMTFWHFF